ncbi:unnamed protein product, partial [Brassica oleracea var. botrytis]
CVCQSVGVAFSHHITNSKATALSRKFSWSIASRKDGVILDALNVQRTSSMHEISSFTCIVCIVWSCLLQTRLMILLSLWLLIWR